MRLLITPEAAHREMMPAAIRKPVGPLAHDAELLDDQVFGARGDDLGEEVFEVAETNSARVCTRMVAALVSTGKKLSRAE